MRHFRKIDYIISFIVFLTLYLLQLIKYDWKVMILVIIASLISSLIVGTITNIILRRKIKR